MITEEFLGGHSTNQPPSSTPPGEYLTGFTLVLALEWWRGGGEKEEEEETEEEMKTVYLRGLSSELNEIMHVQRSAQGLALKRAQATPTIRLSVL